MGRQKDQSLALAQCCGDMFASFLFAHKGIRSQNLHRGLIEDTTRKREHRLTVTLPVEVYEYVKRAAEENLRTMTSQVAWIVRQEMEREEQEGAIDVDG